MLENTDQKSFAYGHFSRSDNDIVKSKKKKKKKKKTVFYTSPKSSELL